MPFVIMGIAGVLTVGMIGICNKTLDSKNKNKKDKERGN